MTKNFSIRHSRHLRETPPSTLRKFWILAGVFVVFIFSLAAEERVPKQLKQVSIVGKLTFLSGMVTKIPCSAPPMELEQFEKVSVWWCYRYCCCPSQFTKLKLFPATSLHHAKLWLQDNSTSSSVLLVFIYWKYSTDVFHLTFFWVWALVSTFFNKLHRHNLL